MPFSYTLLPGNGSNTNFNFSFGYLSRSHIGVKVNGVTTAFTWLTDFSIQVTPAPASGTVVEIRRTTPLDQPAVVWTDGSTLTEQDMNYEARFNLYVNQESRDANDASVTQNSLGVWDGQNRTTTNFADPVDDTSLVTRGYFETVYTPQLDAKVAAATTQANNALNSANVAQGYATAADSSADAAAALLSVFRGQYLGPLATDPTIDGNGNPVSVGDLYFNISSNDMRVYTTDNEWIPAGNAVQGALSRPPGDTPIIATAGQTVVPVVGGYNPHGILVTVNGAVISAPAVDTSNGLTLVFSTPLNAGDKVDYFAFALFDEAQAVPVDGSVTTAKLAASAVTTTKIADKAITEAKLSDALRKAVGTQVFNVAALRLLDKTRHNLAQTNGYYVAGDPGAGTYWLDESDNVSVDNGGSVIVAADGGRWKLLFNHIVYVTQFGIIGDGVRDNAARMTALHDFIASKYAAGNAMKIVWPAGRYVYSQGPNWAITGLNMEAEGEVWLIHTGPGNASFLLDGSYVGGGVRGIKIRGDFRVVPNANSAQGVFVSRIHASEIEITSRGAGTGFQAIYISSCVVTLFKIRAAVNDGGWYNTPTHALYVTQDSPGNQTSYCTFLNPVLEGANTTVFLDGAMGNTFIGGTIEASPNRGLVMSGNAIQNKFFSIDFEENVNYDVYCEGSDNEFISCDTLKKLTIAGGARNTVIGGVHNTVEILAPAVNNVVSSFKYNRFGTGALTITGSKTRTRDLTNAATGVTHNNPPAAVAISVGASPFTYTNQSANDQAVAVVPGTLQGVSLSRLGNFFPLPLTAGVYELSPGDAIAVQYTAPPAMFLLTR